MDSIVIYRSEMERIQDQFWINFTAEHPYVVLVICGLFFLFVLGFIGKVAWDIFKPKRRWSEKLK